MRHEDLISILDATNAYECLAKDVVMRHRGKLTKSQMDILITLKFSGPMTMTKLSKRLAVSKEQATRATAPLVEMGFLNRCRKEENHRLVEVSLSDQGIAFLESDLQEVLAELAQSLSVLNDEELAELLEASKRASQALAKFRTIRASQAN